MKKTLILFLSFFALYAALQAQTNPVAKKVDKAKTASTSTKQTTPTKADGTPDMRYKANKAKEKTNGPKKADGTPDMRYKANKPVTKKKV